MKYRPKVLESAAEQTIAIKPRRPATPPPPSHAGFKIVVVTLLLVMAGAGVFIAIQMYEPPPHPGVEAQRFLDDVAAGAAVARTYDAMRKDQGR